MEVSYSNSQTHIIKTASRSPIVPVLQSCLPNLIFAMTGLASPVSCLAAHRE